MLRLLQMTFLGVYISKIFRGGMPLDPPRMSPAFGARLHDHSHDAGFATAPELLQDKIYIKQKLISQRFQLYLIFLTFFRVKVRHCEYFIAFYSTKHSEWRFKKITAHGKDEILRFPLIPGSSRIHS
jgi:hypothetical protein